MTIQIFSLSLLHKRCTTITEMSIIAIYDKKTSEFHTFVDLKSAAQYCKVHPSTIKRRLPYYEDNLVTMGYCEHHKSGRGTNNLYRR